MAEALIEDVELRIKHPINLNDKWFFDNDTACYDWLRENEPVYRGRLSFLRVWMLSRHEDCEWLLKDDRFVRNRSTATGGSRMPFPLPKSIALLAESMIQQDDPEHRRLRNLVRKAFTPQALKKIQGRVEEVTDELIAELAEGDPDVNLMEAYALPIPVTVIREMVGVSDEDMPKFQNLMKSLTSGLSGLTILKTFAIDMPKVVGFVRELVRKKRNNPGDDILTGLIQAEEEGELLTEDELVSLVFLLVVAGFETTVHLISNGVRILLEHPESLARLQGEPELMDTALEEILRLAGPVQGTKMQFAREPVTVHGVTIPKGAPVVPLFGAANRDPRVFENPDTFDITRSPNKHLSFGHGYHYCLGANLAKLETRVALSRLFRRFPDLALADPAALKRQPMPLWKRLEGLPVRLNG
jgi:cytochrome P450